MPNYTRPKIPGATVFFTVGLADRGSTALVDHIDELRLAVRKTRMERPFFIDAWVVLPDHMHAVWTLPECDAEYSVRWGAIKARFTRSVKRRVGLYPTNGTGTVGCNPTLRRSFSKVKKGDGGIWQRRFWEHHVRNAEDYSAAITYCHCNPVKHGLVEKPEDWPYSSIHRDIATGRWAA